MIAHPEAAQRYSELKRELAREHPQNIESLAFWLGNIDTGGRTSVRPYIM